MNEQKTSRVLTFDKLWLISERELSAREILFSKGKNLLTGGNGTGKSRVTKHCFWALGCEVHKRVWGPWDASTAAALTFTYRGSSYTAVRSHDRFGLLDGDGQFLIATGQYQRYQQVLCDLLGYELTLKRPKSEKFGLAGVPYLAIPSYLDQDGGWGTTWNNFDRLGQFESWVQPVFEMFIGLSTNAYLVAKSKRQELTTRINDIEKELAQQRKAFDEVSKVLAAEAPVLDPMHFKTELRSLATSAGNIQQEQRDLRSKVTKLATQVVRLESDLAMCRAAQEETVGDLVYLTELEPDQALVCPTCGWEHENSFHAKVRLGTDAHALSELIGDLTDRLVKARSKYAELKGKLSLVEERLASFNQQTEEDASRVELKTLIAAYSRKTVSTALSSLEDKAGKRLKPLQADWDAQNVIVKLVEDKNRRKEVKKAYVDRVNGFMNELKAPPEERVAAGKLGQRPPTGGSEMPRSVLAVHLAMLHTNYAFSDTPIFPLVVDTFQHSGQDKDNLPAMINAAYALAVPGQQTIFAAETVPDAVNLDGVEVQTFTEKRRFLQRNAYGSIAPTFAAWLAYIDQQAQQELLAPAASKE